jgi:hypothetical protein
MGRGDQFMTAAYKHPAVLLAYFARIGAEPLNFRRAMVREYKGNYYTERTLIKISADGAIECSNEEHKPTSEESAAIRAAFVNINFPKSITATNAALEQLIKEQKFERSKVFPLYSHSDGKISMAQVRVENDDGSKTFYPWSMWSDGIWRQMEPDGDLPFWKPAKRTNAARVMIHEGAKAAAFVDWLINGKDSDAAEARATHPWAEELSSFEHWGMIGGALAPHRSDYQELRAAQFIEVVYVCDNDWPGRSALKEVSKCFGGPMKGILFDKRWPESWDMADAMPEKLFAKTASGRRYKGPTLRSLMISATWATELLPNPEGRGRPIAALKRTFREEWWHIVSPEAFINCDFPGRILTAAEFNSLVRPYSHVDDVARLLRADQASKAKQMHYLPGQKPGWYGTNDKGQFINTHCPSNIKPEKGDAGPWIEFMERLIPDDGDRHEVMRWCATLIARPATKMLYGLLLISETQGVGKTTLGEKVLAPIIGYENTSFPSETDIVESNFNAWIAHKRIAIVNEIYAGSSTKAYNKLKSVITDRYITVNKKHQSTYEIENWLHIFACSNSARALKLSMDDRRWFVPKITEKAAGPAYWAAFNDWLENAGGLGIIMQWADEWLLDNRQVMAGETAPDSGAKREMIEEQMSPGMMIAANILDEIKLASEGTPVFITDGAIIDVIKNRLYDGRHNDRIEKPATIRRLAKSRGWWIGEAKTRRWSPDGSMRRIMATDAGLAKRLPENLAADGVNEFDIKTLSM